MAEMPYSGVTSFFMKALLEKKYTLPYRVIDALVDTFVSFRHEERAMPVIWHLSLLTFAQRYKHEIRPQVWWRHLGALECCGRLCTVGRSRAASVSYG